MGKRHCEWIKKEILVQFRAAAPPLPLGPRFDKGRRIFIFCLSISWFPPRFFGECGKFTYMDTVFFLHKDSFFFTSIFPPVYPRECFVVCKEGNENVFKACDDDDDVDGFFFQLPTFSFPLSSLAFTQLAIFCFVDSFFFFFAKRLCQCPHFSARKWFEKAFVFGQREERKEGTFWTCSDFLKKPILQFPASNTWEFGSTISQCHRTEPGCGERTKIKNHEKKMPHFVSWLQFGFFKCKFDFPIPLLKGEELNSAGVVWEHNVCANLKRSVFFVSSKYESVNNAPVLRETKIIMIK